jgi:hypothetical protein
MHRLIYTSTATVSLDEEELQREMNHWRAANAHLDITGVLLYSEGQVLQVLEGGAETVHRLFAAIAGDLRHRSIIKLADGPVQDRAFTDWTMQLQTVGTVDFARFMQHLSSGPDHASCLAPLLEMFMLVKP